MSKTITVNQLNANQSVYSVDDYRKMVNYESGTNKGYVRFAKDANGQLKIEKFNNKIDVPLSWRSNVSAEHNKSVRQKFLSAMENDLRYMGNAANTIRKMILAPKEPGENVESPGKALSRRDVKRISCLPWRQSMCFQQFPGKRDDSVVIGGHERQSFKCLHALSDGGLASF